MTAARIGAVIVALMAIAFLVINRSQLPDAWVAAKQADPRFLVPAALVAIAYLLNYGAMYRNAYRAVGLELPFWTAFRLANAAHFLNMTIVNSGGMAGLGVFLPEAAARQQDRGRAISAYLLVALLGHFVFAFVLAAALAVAASDGQVGKVEMIAAGIFAAYTLFSALLLFAAARSKNAVRWLHGRPAAVRRWTLARVGRAAPHRETSVDAADELYEALRMMLGRPLSMVPPAIHAFLAEVTGILSLWLCLRAFGLHPGLEEPLVGYSMGVLFSIVGFLPAGVGFAEAGIAVALGSFGYAAVEIALVVIAYRLFEVWIPFLAGAISLRGVFRAPAESR